MARNNGELPEHLRQLRDEIYELRMKLEKAFHRIRTYPVGHISLAEANSLLHSMIRHRDIINEKRDSVYGTIENEEMLHILHTTLVRTNEFVNRASEEIERGYRQ